MQIKWEIVSERPYALGLKISITPLKEIPFLIPTAIC